MAKSDWSTGIKKLQRKVKELKGTKSIPFNELFNSSFMSRYTSQSTIDEFFKAGGFEFKTEEEFEEISIEMLDKHVQDSTSFISWNEMKTKAGELWVLNKIDI